MTQPQTDGKTSKVPRSPLSAATLALICGGMILTLALGIRHGFGLFLQPMSLANGWGREVFGLSVALSNLIWGVAQPFTGMLADRIGARRVLIAGGTLFCAGLAGMAHSTQPWHLVLSIGVLVGIGMSCCTFNIVLSALGRLSPPEKRSKVFGAASSAGSFGQFLLMPMVAVLIGSIGWYWALVALAVAVAMVVPLSTGIRDQGYGSSLNADGTPQTGLVSTREAVCAAATNRNFWLLGLGYFTCGFQVVFIGTHFPAYVVDKGLTAFDGTVALALIGFFNIFGSYYAGVLGQRFHKTYLLAIAYLSRSVLIVLMLSFPLTAWSVYLFAMGLGITWLATVPLTSGVVAGIWGVRHMAMLTGMVFLFHQVGSFFGGWLGGLIFDRTGSYDLVWWIAIGLGLTAAVINLPIDERPAQPRDAVPGAVAGATRATAG
jgi:MFS family permease